jgi:hypothetical protein
MCGMLMCLFVHHSPIEVIEVKDLFHGTKSRSPQIVNLNGMFLKRKKERCEDNRF